MLKNLPKEIIYYCAIPVAIILVVDLLLLLLMRKKEDNAFRFGNIIRISLMLMVSIVLPLIIGYTIWTISYFVNKQILFEHLLYVILIVILAVALMVLLIWILIKSLKLIQNVQENQG